jgi:hypothetical protein
MELDRDAYHSLASAGRAKVLQVSLSGVQGARCIFGTPSHLSVAMSQPYPHSSIVSAD